MPRLQNSQPHKRRVPHFSRFSRSGLLRDTPGAPLLALFEKWALRALRPLKQDRGSAILEFAIALPLLVVFVVGIYDFSGAFNQKQKIAQAAQEGAIIAGAQPMSDIEPSSSSLPTNPGSLKPVVTAIFNSLAASATLPNANQGTCKLTPFPTPTQPGNALTWVYTIGGCGATGDSLVITINRGWVSPVPVAVGTIVTVAFPYHWRFNSVIQSLIPGANYAATTPVTEVATVHNQT